MQKWEYLFVNLNYANGEWRARYVNGKELPNWKKETVYNYANKIGNEGWELVDAPYSIGSTDYYWRMVFKRPK